MAAPVASDELWWVLQHEGGTGSEEGLMEKDDGGRRWELTVRGLKWQRLRLRHGERRSGGQFGPEVTGGV
jgi:hypothetical protein